MKNSGGGQTGADIPFAHPFGLNGYRFVLDLHTNRAFSLSSGEARAFDRWFEGTALEDLAAEFPKETAAIKSLRQEGLFCSARPRALAFGLDWEGIREAILHERSHTILEITLQCNLRCRYCTFGHGFQGHRTLGSGRMSEELLEKSVDAALVHGKRLAEISIGFYGGEPLTAFDSLRKTVLYAKRRATGKKIRFSMTTNATLLDPAKAKFLRDSGFSVLVSLDGPQVMHERHRVYPDGRGTYEDVIKGLRILLDTFPPEKHQKIGLNMVAPSAGWIPSLEELWDREPWLPRTLRAQADIVNPPQGFRPPPAPTSHAFARYREQWLARLGKGEIGGMSLAYEEHDMPLAKLHHRKVFAGRRESFFPNGCCIPGSRKIYVRIDGTYQICERVHGAPTIGSVAEGVDLASVRRIIDEYANLSYPDCRECFAITNCGLCFVHAYEEGRFSAEKKRRYCSAMKKAFSENLGLYGYIGVNHPEKLAEWDTVEIS